MNSFGFSATLTQMSPIFTQKLLVCHDRCVLFPTINTILSCDISSFSDTDNCAVEDWFITQDDLLGKEADLPIQTVCECLREQAVAEVGQYLQYYKQLNWFNIMQWYPTKNFEEDNGKHDEGMQWWKQFKTYTRHNNVNELWQYFNVMEWWKGVGQQYHPNIQVVAAINLARSYSNTQQEHDFSMPPGF